MTIGEIQAALKRKPMDADVRFDFVYFAPHGCHSYRGYYDRPAIGYSNGKDITVLGLLALLDTLLTEQFTGYKGGEYSYSDDQVLYVANHNESGGTVITDVMDDGCGVRLETKVIDA